MQEWNAPPPPSSYPSSPCPLWVLFLSPGSPPPRPQECVCSVLFLLQLSRCSLPFGWFSSALLLFCVPEVWTPSFSSLLWLHVACSLCLLSGFNVFLCFFCLFPRLFLLAVLVFTAPLRVNVCVNHLKRCKTSNLWFLASRYLVLSFYFNLQGGAISCFQLIAQRRGLHSWLIWLWDAGVTYLPFQSNFAVFHSIVYGNRLSPELACRSFECSNSFNFWQLLDTCWVFSPTHSCQMRSTT